MKKILAILSLVAVLSSVSPSAMAAPHGPGGHGGPGMHGGRPAMHHPAPPPRHDYHRHHNSVTLFTGIGARHSYWGYPYCDYRLGYYGYYPVGCVPPCPPVAVPYTNVGVGLNFRF